MDYCKECWEENTLLSTGRVSGTEKSDRRYRSLLMKVVFLGDFCKTRRLSMGF